MRSNDSEEWTRNVKRQCFVCFSSLEKERKKNKVKGAKAEKSRRNDEEDGKCKKQKDKKRYILQPIDLFKCVRNDDDDGGVESNGSDSWSRTWSSSIGTGIAKTKGRGKEREEGKMAHILRTRCYLLLLLLYRAPKIFILFSSSIRI